MNENFVDWKYERAYVMSPLSSKLFPFPRLDDNRLMIAPSRL